MSVMDKMKNSWQRASGKAKTAGGMAVGDPAVERRGRRRQVGADLKDAGEQGKDMGRKLKRSFKH